MSRLQQGLWWFKQRFPRAAWALRSMRPSRRREERIYEGKSAREIFSTIYDENKWGSSESRSGAGSTMRATTSLREQLPKVVRSLKARSLLDAPCGDFNWMQHVDLGVDHYIGGDIVPALVEQLKAKYSSPTRTFVQLDIVRDPLPAADVFFCRDCFLHLSFEHINGALQNFLRSPAKHLITSTFRDTRANLDTFTGGVRMLNLRHAPFNFPEPIEYIEDRGEGKFDRCLGVWSKEQVAKAMGSRVTVEAQAAR